MLKKILIGVLIFIIGVIVGALLVCFCRNMMLTIPPKVVDYNKESQKRIEEENQRLKEKKQLPANMMSVNRSGELSKETQDEIEAIKKKGEQSIKETLEQAEKVLNIMRKYKNKELEDFYKLVGTRDLTKVDVKYSPNFDQIVLTCIDIRILLKKRKRF